MFDDFLSRISEASRFFKYSTKIWDFQSSIISKREKVVGLLDKASKTELTLPLTYSISKS